MISDDPGLIVRPEVAIQQIDAEQKPIVTTGPGGSDAVKPRPTPPESGEGKDQVEPEPPQMPRLKRFHGSVTLDPTRVGRDAGRIADEVIAHLASLVNVDVEVTLEIKAKIPDGAPENVVRIVTENSRTLRFNAHGFEVE